MVVGWFTGSRDRQGIGYGSPATDYQGKKTTKREMVHSDGGSQYASHEYRTVPNEKGHIQSMNGFGNCYDNAVMEGFSTF